ncbi:MAG: IMP dehydrogenase [Alphaproteobacteria bacterium]|jgi:IMP dehydrogenase
MANKLKLENITTALTFDDVLLKPAYSEVLPTQTETFSLLTKDIELGIPLVSAAMDTVTESKLAIAMAQNGGIGVIHKNFTIKEQADEILKVKKFESGMVVNPITISPESTLADVLVLMDRYSISGIPVVDGNNKLQGIITNRDVRFALNKRQKVAELMTKDNLITVKEGVSLDDAKKLLHKHRIEKLVVVDGHYKCIGLITVKDIEKSQKHPNSTKDAKGRLRVAGAVGVGVEAIERARALVENEIDVLVVDTAHGHSKGVIEAVKNLRKLFGKKQNIIAGNIATFEAAKALIEAGVDALKVGIGPGSICTTRIIAGVGLPQLSAISEVKRACQKTAVKLIADGGIKYSGDIAKAIAVGADSVMIGSLFAGTRESPGEVILYQGRSYKTYRGMGSIGAMERGSADRYFQEDVKEKLKLVPEGVEGRVPYKGSLTEVIHQLIGGLRSSMGYTGNKTILEMQNNCEFIKITQAGLRESHAHDVVVTREAPNYGVGE